MSTNSRCTQVFISHRKFFIYSCVISSIPIIFYLIFVIPYFYRVPLFRISWRKELWLRSTTHTSSILTKASSIPITTTIESRTNTTNISLQFSEPQFQSNLSSTYPHLPILIYTHNLSLLHNVTKLILLGNAFFGYENWGLDAVGKSSAEIMTQLTCPYLANYCNITADKKLFSKADAIVYHMRDSFNRKKAAKERRPHQRIVFSLWESPTYTPNLKPYNGFFNWTMTYRWDSHVLTSYYSTNAYIHKSTYYYQFLLQESAKRNRTFDFKRVDYRPSDEVIANKTLGTVAALISNCGGPSRRLFLIKNLKRFIDVKVYGRCGEKCPEQVDCREFIAKRYYFFLSFENSLCKEYTTEKFFSTLEHPIVPIVHGRTNYSHLIPSSGFIDVNDFASLSALAQYIREVRQNKEKYLSYFAWKKDYVWGVSQYLTPFCDLCLRLHVDSTPNVVDDLDAWWNNNACQRPRLLKS